MSLSKGRSARSARKRGRYLTHKIKTALSYDVAEIARLLGVHRNTVRQWQKTGLRPIDDRRPILIHGAALKSFLSEKQSARRRKCGPGELFCFRCRMPRKPWGGMVEISKVSEKIARATALCEVCEAEMHRAIRSDAIAEFEDCEAPRWHPDD
jgi:hypothetical protein